MLLNLAILINPLAGLYLTGLSNEGGLRGKFLCLGEPQGYPYRYNLMLQA
jgi:hypothetical protein